MRTSLHEFDASQGLKETSNLSFLNHVITNAVFSTAFFPALLLAVARSPLHRFSESLWEIANAAVSALLLGLILALIVAVVSRRRKDSPEEGPPSPTPSPARSREVPRYGGAPPGQPSPPPPVRFDRELLDALEWRAFERLATAYFRTQGFDANRLRAGADGGVDIVLRKSEEKDRYVQCKAWNVYTVGVKPVRELFGVMAASGIRRGYFLTTHGFTKEAVEFARSTSLEIVTGDDLLERLNALDVKTRQDLYEDVTRGDYTTPTCPSCDIKMVRREGSNGPFWGCPNYGPRKCRRHFPIRS